MKKSVDKNPFINSGARVTAEEEKMILGESSEIDDNSEEELEKIKDLIPQNGTPTVEDGFQKMLAILGKKAPVMGEDHVTKLEDLADIPEPDMSESPFTKKEETKEIKPQPDFKVFKNDAVEKAVVNSVKEQTTDKKEEKIITKSEELGLNYKDEEILPLVDSLMMKGYVSETTTLRGYKITFRTSFFWEEKEVALRTDAQFNENINMKSTLSFFYDLYSLAANLEQFGDFYFKPLLKGTPDELKKSLDERIEFIEGLSSPFISILINKRLEFLKKIQFLTDNIDRLLKAF